MQCCGAATFLGGSGSDQIGSAPAPGNKKRRYREDPTPYTKISYFVLSKSELLIQVLFWSDLPLLTAYTSCLTQEQGFSFLLA